MKKIIIISFLSLLGCNQNKPVQKEVEIQKAEFPEFRKQDAESLANLPLTCITQEFPNKLGQVLASESDLARPKELRPVFYGCFDWHSSVHGHWSLINLLKNYPDLSQAEEIKEKLQLHFREEKIQKEIEFFSTEGNESFERTYGWAWLFQLATELKRWNDPMAEELLLKLQPLVEVLEIKMIDFLPKLVYPIRVGEHPNTAFALSLTFDYAVSFNKEKLKELIIQRAKDFYLNDQSCPINWEPSGYDFLSPCLEEAKLMSKILQEDEFRKWLIGFMPEIYDSNFHLAIAKVSDRSDGKLVHLDGLNFSRAWNLFELSTHPDLSHLRNLGNLHFAAAYPNLIGDSYEGSHWLGSFALYAIQQEAD